MHRKVDPADPEAAVGQELSGQRQTIPIREDDGRRAATQGLEQSLVGDGPSPSSEGLHGVSLIAQMPGCGRAERSDVIHCRIEEEAGAPSRVGAGGRPSVRLGKKGVKTDVEQARGGHGSHQDPDRGVIARAPLSGKQAQDWCKGDVDRRFWVERGPDDGVVRQDCRGIHGRTPGIRWDGGPSHGTAPRKGHLLFDQIIKPYRFSNAKL